MNQPIKKPVCHYLKEVYADYSKKLLEENPDWWGKYGSKVKMKNCYLYAKDKSGKPVLKMSWYKWKEIVSSFFYRAKYRIIEGEVLTMGKLGRIKAIRIERNFSKPVLDKGATYKDMVLNPDGTIRKVYKTSEDYCRISWEKYHMLANESRYRFKPSSMNTITGKGFKIEFSRALTEDPLLKYRYKYFPIKRKAPCNTSTAL